MLKWHAQAITAPPFSLWGRALKQSLRPATAVFTPLPCPSTRKTWQVLQLWRPAGPWRDWLPAHAPQEWEGVANSCLWSGSFLVQCSAMTVVLLLAFCPSVMTARVKRGTWFSRLSGWLGVFSASSEQWQQAPLTLPTLWKVKNTWRRGIIHPRTKRPIWQSQDFIHSHSPPKCL